MHKRSMLVGFGLGLLLAGMCGLIFGGMRFMGRGYADGAPRSESAAQSDGYTEGYYDGMRSGGWHHGHGGFWALPFMALMCLFPLVLISVCMGVMRKARRQHWHRHHHTTWV